MTPRAASQQCQDPRTSLQVFTADSFTSEQISTLLRLNIYHHIYHLRPSPIHPKVLTPIHPKLLTPFMLGWFLIPSVQKARACSKQPERLSLNCLNCDANMTPGHQCEALDSDSSWEDVDSEQELFPTFEPDSEDWENNFSDRIRRFHGLNPSS